MGVGGNVDTGRAPIGGGSGGRCAAALAAAWTTLGGSHAWIFRETCRRPAPRVSDGRPDMH
eukprot:5311644-Prymnesium_polylepis.1